MAKEITIVKTNRVNDKLLRSNYHNVWSLWNKGKKILYKFNIDEYHPNYIKMLTGSTVETFLITSDLDMMLENKQLTAVQEYSSGQNMQEKYEVKVLPSEEYPGYVKLARPTETVWINGTVILKKDLSICGEFIPADAVKLAFDSFEKDESNDDSNESQGASTEYNLKSHKKIKFDIVPSIKMQVWPKQANTWIARERPYNKPNCDVLNQIIKDGCHFVCKQPPQLKDSRPYFYFRLSFSSAERELMWNWDSTQHLVYHSLKRIQRKLGVSDIIQTYFIKTMMFWEYEKKPDTFWTGLTIAQIVKYLWTKLVCCVRNGYLQHYFLGSCNILDSVSVHELDSCLHNEENFVENILLDISNFMVQTDGEKLFGDKLTCAIAARVSADMSCEIYRNRLPFQEEMNNSNDYIVPIISHSIKLLHDCLDDTNTIALVALICASAYHTYSDYSMLYKPSVKCDGTKHIQTALAWYTAYMEHIKASSSYVEACYLDCLHKNGKLDEATDFFNKPRINLDVVKHEYFMFFARDVKYKLDEHWEFLFLQMTRLYESKFFQQFRIPISVYVLFLNARAKETMKVSDSTVTGISITDEDIKTAEFHLHVEPLMTRMMHYPLYLCMLLYLKSVHKYGYMDMNLFRHCIDNFFTKLRKIVPPL